MSKPDSWMPFYWGDFFLDTASFDAERTGVYACLLGHAWNNGGWLPDDDEELARLARCTADQWKRHRKRLGSAPFFIVNAGRWTQKRLSAEYEKALAIYRTSVDNGKRGGRPPKPQTGEATTNTENRPVNPPVPPPANPPPPRPGNPNVTREKHNHNHKVPTTKDETPKPAAPPAPLGVTAENWEAWVRRKGRKQTAAADRLQRKHLEEWRQAGHDVNRIVEAAVANGWQGLHPIERRGPFRDREPSFAERKAANIDAMINGTKGEHHERERDITGVAERVDTEAAQAIPIDLRKPSR